MCLCEYKNKTFKPRATLRSLRYLSFLKLFDLTLLQFNVENIITSCHHAGGLHAQCH